MNKARGLAALVLMSAAVAAQAADLPKEGNFDVTACWSGTGFPLAFSKTNNAFSYENTGSLRSNPPGGMFDNNTFHCVGTIMNLGKTTRWIALCEGVDKDGDKRLTFLERTGDGKVRREFISGTGKFEGMVETDTKVLPLGPFPTIKPGTFQNCNRQTGHYKLK